MTATPDGIKLGDHVYPPWFVAAHWIATDPEGYVLALNEAKQLGYVKASDEWMNLSEPLSDRLQDVAHKLAREGRLPEFEEFFR